jgi:cellulose synthase/poly-beta-1,6-N-acetylglucosamine synthase-like glycosyltransferase
MRCGRIERIRDQAGPLRMLNHKINTCSIGIMAFDEALNIEFLILDLLRQEMKEFCIAEIIVVTSGCTDTTQDIVRRMAEKNGKIRVLIEEKRRGKASAINLFLSQAGGDYIILISADVRVEKHALEKVLIPLLESKAGMTGGRPVPVNDTDSFMGYGAWFLWHLHHQLSLSQPKLGELVAFINCIEEIPVQTATDEALIEALFSNRGLSIKYVPDALVYNKGPESIREFLSQRERIFIGHLWVKKNYGYSVASLNNGLIMKLVIKNIKFNPKHFVWIFGLISLEAFARMRGALKFVFLRRNPYIWDRIPTSKF